MLFVPLPFVLTLLLCIVLFRLYQQRETLPSSKLFILLISTYAIGTVLIGLRWGYDLKEVLPYMAILAILWPVLAWLSFRNLSLEAPALRWRRDWLHSLPLLFVLLQILLFPNFIDWYIILINLTYGLALLRLANKGPNALSSVRLEQVVMVQKAIYATAFILILFALLDFIIYLDIRHNGGVNSASIVTFANIPMIFVLGVVASIASQSEPEPEQEQENILLARQIVFLEKTGKVASENIFKEEIPNDKDNSFDLVLVERLDAFMLETQLYKDVDLNLAKLARKFGRPTRQISSAINKVKSVNVSQYVNAYRVQTLCELLKNTNHSITQLQFDAGFQTKSNCNREFFRVMGVSPKQWREQQYGL